MKTVKLDCCHNTDQFLIGDTFGSGRVRVEGTCPVCGATDPLGTVVSTRDLDAEEEKEEEEEECTCGVTNGILAAYRSYDFSLGSLVLCTTRQKRAKQDAELARCVEEIARCRAHQHSASCAAV